MGLCPSRRQYVQMPGDASTARKGLTLCGPEQIQVLRGNYSGKEVVLYLCSERHEDAIDLTRENGVVDAYEDWIPIPVPKFHSKSAWRSKKGLSQDQAKKWAARQLEEAEDDDDGEMSKDGAVLVFVADGNKGKSYLFVPDLVDCREGVLPENAVAFEWGDLDDEAREFRRRRKMRQEMTLEELDALLAKRKEDRRKQGIELFDDWLLRQCSGKIPVEVVLESPVPAEEVKIHVEEKVDPAPLAHSCLRGMELDSDSDSEDENDGGCDAYIEYLRRRLASELPGALHCADPRELGEGSEDFRLRDAFQSLLQEPRPKDLEEVELDALGASYPSDEDGESDEEDDQDSKDVLPVVPSFEGFCGGASDVLYYHPEVKVDYAPFLRKCVGSTEALENFFKRLFFDTVPEALSQLTLTEETRPFTRCRSLIYQPKNGKMQRRPKERPRIPVKVLPTDCFLVDKSDTPRTWVSALAQRVRQLGGENLVSAAQTAYLMEVQRLLADPKHADEDGDYFEAWLRECHPDIYEDIDISDPAEVVKKTVVASETTPKRKHKLGEICIPNVKEVFTDLMLWDPEERISNKRERVMAKILVDVYMLCIVDVALALLTAEAMLRADGPQVIVVYAGGAHIRNQVKFWSLQGFSSTGLPQNGLVGQEEYEDFEPHLLEMPDALGDFSQLFTLK